MVAPGGLTDINEVKYLILYVLKMCDVPIPKDTLNDIILNDDLVNYFDYCCAIAEMVVSKHVSVSVVDNEERVLCTPLGIEAVEIFYKDLPLNVRDKASSSAKIMIESWKAKAGIVAYYIKKNNEFMVRLGLRENTKVIFTLDLFCPNDDQARLICKNFKSNPTKNFMRIITLLTEV